MPSTVVASSNGKAVVQFSSGNSPCCFIKQVDLASAQIGDLPALQSCGGSAIAGADHGNKIFIAQTGCNAGSVYLYDVPSGNLQFTYLGMYISSPAASADGNAFTTGAAFVPTALDGDLELRARLWRPVFYNGATPLLGQTLNPSGSLIYDPTTLTITGGPIHNYIDVLDIHHGKYASRVITPEFLGSSTSVGRLLTIDTSGRRMFALTQSGLSVMEFVAAPLSVGGVYPSYGGPAGGTVATVRGSGFQSGALLKFGNTSVNTTWVDENTLSAIVPALPLGLAAITVTNPDGTSYRWADGFLVMNQRPAPTIASISPSQGEATSGGPLITVSGTNFFNDSIVRLDGTDRPTTFVSASQLMAQLSQDDLRTSRTSQITVFTSLGGGVSNAKTFTVVNPVPQLALLSPSRLDVGGPDTGIIIFGSNFLSNSVVRWNGTPLPTTYDTSFQTLNIAVPASLIAVAGTATIDVVNPAPGGGTSSPLQLVIGPKASLSHLS